MAARDRAHLRSFVCVAGHELRITRRCVSNDLGDSAEASFDELANRHGIVKAFRRERRAATAGVDSIGSAGGDRPLTVLRHTHHWRGATWFDPELGVVWLCACRRHRSGDPDDAFPYFLELRDAGQIWPDDDDREALEVDRADQFTAFVLTDAPALLAAARAAPEAEQVATIGREPVAIVVRIVETMEETFVAVSGLRLSLPGLQLLLVALYPERGFEEWRTEASLPTRPLDPTRAEICLSIVHG